MAEGKGECLLFTDDFFFFWGVDRVYFSIRFFRPQGGSKFLSAEPGRAARARVPTLAQVGGLRRNVRIPWLSNCGVRLFTDIYTRQTGHTNYQ